MIQAAFEQIEAVFAQALERPPEQWPSYLTVTAPEDQEVRAEVLALLRAHQGRGRFDRIAERLIGVQPAAGSILLATQLDRLRRVLADRYTIEREVGRGGMATVFLATDLKHDRRVAIKVLRPDLAATLGPERFLREIKTAARLQHPHILSLHDSGEAGDFLYYVMPYVEGQTLRERLAKEKQLPVDDALQIAREVADALTYAHSRDVIHRDIKPENILLEAGHAVVADFGIARAITAAGGEHLTETGVALGTPAYMSPEQAAGDKMLDGRSDIYSLGCVLYEMLAGQPPFTGPTVESVVRQHITAEPPPVTQLRPSVPLAVHAALRRMLAKTPADRWDSAVQLAEVLATASATAPPTGVPERGRRRLAKRKLAVVGMTAALAVATVLVLLWPASSPGVPPDRVIVAPFANQTGDAALDPIGYMAANWITQGLQEAQVMQVVPWLTAQQAWRWVQDQQAAQRVSDPASALAEETGASVVISGTVYRQGQAIQVQAEIIDAGGKRALASLAPVGGPVDSAGRLVQEVRDRVIGSMAVSFDDRFKRWVGVAQRPPSPAAYREFSEGLTLYLTSTSDATDREGATRFRRAITLDTTFTQAFIFLTIMHLHLSELAEADSMVRVLERRRDEMTAYDRLWVEALRGRLAGDNERVLASMRQAAKMAPGSKAVYNWGWTAEHTNRPREAVEALRTLDPERGPMRGFQSYFGVLTDALHRLGEYDRQLEAAREWQRLYPDDVRGWGQQLNALAALGRLDDIRTLLREAPGLWVSPNRLQAQLVWMGSELLRHGHRDAADDLWNRVAEWYRAQPPGSVDAVEDRHAFGDALNFTGRHVEARALFQELVREHPESPFWLFHLGVAAAWAGDSVEARAIDARLARMDRSSLFESHTDARARIAAALGQRDEAMRLLRQAEHEGHSFFSTWHADPELQSLWDFAPYLEFMKPKG